MDRSSLFLYGNPDGSLMHPGAPTEQTAQAQSSGANDPQLQFSGYPSLMTQYFQSQVQQQQQQQQQQQPQQQPTGGFDSRFAGFNGYQGGSSMMNGPSGGMGPGSAIGFNGGFGQSPGMMSNPGAGMMMPMNMNVGNPMMPPPTNPSMFSQQWMGPASYAMPTQGPADDPYADSGILGPWSAASAALLGKMVSGAPGADVKGSKKGRGKKASKEGKPKRPLSAYNLFFKAERARILEKIPASGDKPEAPEEEEEEEEKGSEADGKDTRKKKKRPHGKIGFESLAKVIGQRWQELDPEQVELYKKEAEVDMKRYKQEMEVYLGRKDMPEGGRKEIVNEDDALEVPIPKRIKIEEGANGE